MQVFMNQIGHNRSIQNMELSSSLKGEHASPKWRIDFSLRNAIGDFIGFIYYVTEWLLIQLETF